MLSKYQLNDRDNINCAWNKFHSYLMQVMKQCVPQKYVRCKAKDPPWLNEELRRCCRKKHSMFKKWKKSQKPDLYHKYKLLRNKLCNQLKYAKQNFFSSLLDNDSPGKRFWGYCKSRSGQSSIPDSINYNGVTANTPADIATKFSCFFSECFNRADASNVPIPHYETTSSLSLLSCSSQSVRSN